MATFLFQIGSNSVSSLTMESVFRLLTWPISSSKPGQFLLQVTVGMVTALEMLNLPLEGTHHRGGDDAWNIGRILGTLLRFSANAQQRT